MAITLTKKVTGTWADGLPPQVGPGSIGDIILPFVNDMETQEKTDGVYYYVDGATTYRLWADQTSALAFVDVCNNAASAVGRTDLSMVIEDF